MRQGAVKDMQFPMLLVYYDGNDRKACVVDTRDGPFGKTCEDLGLDPMFDVIALIDIFSTGPEPLVVVDDVQFKLWTCRFAIHRDEATHRFPTSVHWGEGYFDDGFRYVVADSDEDAFSEAAIRGDMTMGNIQRKRADGKWEFCE